jgi:hypothetical protein
MKELTLENLKADGFKDFVLDWIEPLLKNGGPIPDEWASEPVTFFCAMQKGYIPQMDEMREVACRDPYTAYHYAVNVDKCPSDETRTAACKSPEAAFYYARDVDQGPHDETRESAFRDTKHGSMYVLFIDGCPSEAGWNVVKNDPFYADFYKEWEKTR